MNQKNHAFSLKELSLPMLVILLISILLGGCHLTPQSCDITFEDGDGIELLSREVEEGCCITVPSDPTRLGYQFTTWYQKDAATPWIFTTEVFTDIILEARGVA